MAGLQLADDVPSPAKRAKLSGEDASTVKQQREVRPTAAHSDKTGARPARPQKCADFAVTHLEDFYKANPPFRQPIEVGSFSFDSRGTDPAVWLDWLRSCPSEQRSGVPLAAALQCWHLERR